MVKNSRRAVITGLGVISPIGSTPARFWDALLAGVSGIGTIRAFDPTQLPCRIAGEIPDFVAKAVIEKNYRKYLNAMSRPVQLGVVAAQFAMQNAGLAKGSIEPERFGVEFASVMGASDLNDLARMSKVSSIGPSKPVNMAAYGRDGVPEMPPMWMLKYLPNMPACHTTILFDAQGPSNTLISNDAAGVMAFGEALRILQRGAADFMLVGGSDSKLNPLSQSRFNSFAPLTRVTESPQTAIRPFDRDCSGTCLGEGAGAFALEELDHARSRGATIIGEVMGYATGMDRGLTGTGLGRVIRNALTDAGIQPNDIDHVNAHGMGVRDMDAFEARGIAAVFGHEVPVFAPLSRFGNMVGAAGIVEGMCSVLALQHKLLPGTLNHDNLAPGCSITVHTGPPRPVTRPYALKITATDLGQCAAVVFRGWE